MASGQASVNFADTGKSFALRGNGLLNAIEPEYDQTPASLVTPLKITHFRDPFRGNDNLVATSARAQAYGSTFEVVMSHNVLQDYIPGDAVTGDSTGFARWEARCREAAQYVKDNNNGRVVQWDVWNEADIFFAGRPASQYLETYKRGVQQIRAVDPSAVIIGPSFGDYRDGPSNYSNVTMDQFLDYAKTNVVLPNILSWHEFTFTPNSGSGSIVSNVAAAKSLMASKGINIPKISLNEILGPDEVFNPGILPHYFSNVERAGVDTAVHSTWNGPTGASNENGNVLSGLLTTDSRPINSGLPDPRQRRSTWYAYERYARMTGEVVTVTAGNNIDGIATKDNGVAQFLLGRRDVSGGGNAMQTLTLNNIDDIDGFAVGGQFRVLAEVIDNSDEAASNGPITTINNALFTLGANGTLSLMLTSFNRGDAYFITLTAVPEPASLLAGLGASALLLQRRRRITGI